MASSVVAKGRTEAAADAPVSTSAPAEPTLVATRTVASVWRGDASGPDTTPRYTASQLPIVDREAYEIDGEVARGGIGRILRARSVHLDRTVAIKELLVPGDAAEERFVYEALVTARLQHPSIVSIYEAGRWPSGELFYAMKLVSGRSLADVLRDLGSGSGDRSQLPARLALLPHVIAVADAMAYAHSERIIHRDLKPANVIVGSFGESIVIDWGLAKDLAGSAPPPEPLPGTGLSPSGEGLTVAGAVIGTPAYMPPEQAKGLPVDERADVYALGAILYHVLAGAPPYEGGDVRSILRAVAEGPPRSLGKRDKAIPVELSTIVGKAMGREPADRYPTARELADDLRRYTTGQIVGAHKYTRAELAQRFVRRYRTFLSVGAAALCVVAATGVVSMRRIMVAADHAAQEQVKATRRADDLTLEQARNATARDPNTALGLLASLSHSFDRWSAARVIAADARSRGLATVLRGHEEYIDDVLFSPDGAKVATASDDHTVRLWDVETGAGQVLGGHGDEAWRLSFLLGGKVLASGGKDQTIRLWDAATGTPLAQLSRGLVHEIEAVPHRNAIVALTHEHDLWLWDVETHEDRPLVTGGDSMIAGFSVSEDGRHVEWLADTGDLRDVDLDTGERRTLGVLKRPWKSSVLSRGARYVAVRKDDGSVKELDVAGGRVREVVGETPAVVKSMGSMAYSPDGKTLAFRGEGTTLVLADATTGARRVLDGRQDAIVEPRFSPDGRHLATTCADHTLQLWNLDTGEVRTLYGFADTIVKVDFSPDGRLLAACSADHTARVFPVEPEDGGILGTHAAAVATAALSPDGDLVASGDEGGVIRLWDRRRPDAPVDLDGHTGAVNRLAWSPDGALLASVSYDQTLRLWDRSGDALGVFPLHALWVASLLFSPDGRHLAWGGDRGEIGVLDLPQTPGSVVRDGGDSHVRHLPGDGQVWALAFSPDGQTLASGGEDKVVRLWSLATGEPRDLRGHVQDVTALAFSPDGKTLVSGGFDHTLRYWDLATGESRAVDAGGGGVLQLAFSQSGTALYSLSRVDTGIRVWDARTGKLERMLRGHRGGVLRFALSPDGGRVATASEDHTARLWDLATGEARELRGHRADVTWVAFSPDGRTVLTASKDRTLRSFKDDLPMDPAEIERALTTGDRGTRPARARAARPQG